MNQNEKNKNIFQPMKKSVFVKALIFMLTLFVSFLIISNIAEINEKRNELEELQQQREEKRLRIERLGRQLEAKVDDAYIEDFAQSRLGLHRQGEILFYNNLFN